MPSEYRNTPIEKLLQYHNLRKKLSPYKKPEILLGMCMDDRIQLSLPKNFAYVIRTGGGNLRYNEFQISYAISVGGVTSIALIGHDDCGMVNLAAKKEKFIHGLVDKAGWDKKAAEEHFTACSSMFEIDDAVGFTFLEAKRLKAKYPKITVVPMLYKVENDRLYLITD
ncbi:MAG: carbonic anhydrase [Proteobacteria bacterium]|nr:carbonic anhydrase [Pseudomonadota bacterium]